MFERREKIHPASYPHFPILWPSCGLHNNHHFKLHCIHTSQTHQRNNGKCQTLSQLCSKPSRCHNHLPCKRPGSCPLQQCIILKQNKSSCTGGHFFMSSEVPNPANNSTVHNIAQLIKAVMSLATEAELSELYINTHEVIPMIQLLAKTGHIQPPTPTQTNNSTAIGVVNSNNQP